MDRIERIDSDLHSDRRQAVAAIEMARALYRKRAQEPEVEAVGETSSQEIDDLSVSKKKKREQSERRHTAAYAEYDVDADSHEVLVRIIDSSTGKVVRTIPPDELAKEMAHEDPYRRYQFSTQV